MYDTAYSLISYESCMCVCDSNSDEIWTKMYCFAFLLCVYVCVHVLSSPTYLWFQHQHHGMESTRWDQAWSWRSWGYVESHVMPCHVTGGQSAWPCIVHLQSLHQSRDKLRWGGEGWCNDTCNHTLLMWAWVTMFNLFSRSRPCLHFRKLFSFYTSQFVHACVSVSYCV